MVSAGCVVTLLVGAKDNRNLWIAKVKKALFVN